MRNLRNNTPPKDAELQGCAILFRLNLADRQFYVSRGIDLILGTTAVSWAYKEGFFRLGKFGLIAQNTSFGWVISGSQTKPEIRQCLTAAAENPKNEAGPRELADILSKFWVLEEVPELPRTSIDDVECERLFVQGVRRNEPGRYIVRLPLRPDRKRLAGKSLDHAIRALESMERRARRDHGLKEAYEKFMADYESMGHMCPVDASNDLPGQAGINYIPHHGIWQMSDGRPKLRVVFNASKPTSTGHSLNDLLYRGAKLQQDLFSELLRW